MRIRYLLCALGLALACDSSPDFDSDNPARGPGHLVGNGDPVSDGNFSGGDDVIPVARSVTPPPGESAGDCDVACRQYCAGLDLKNPVHRGLCPVLWGVGLSTRTIDTGESCRRLFIDMMGRMPTYAEVVDTCKDKSWSQIVHDLMNTEEFVLVNQRRYADFFLYDTQSASVEGIYDLDDLVGKLVRGLVSYDQFAAVAASHPGFLRRFATPEDIAEAVFSRFMGRPPFDYERADFARLYQVWRPSYIDHVPLGLRLPDAFIGYSCVNDQGEPDPALIGQCTSTLFGFNQVVMKPDYRTAGTQGDRQMWSSLISPQEWTLLQTPGRALATLPIFWETAVDQVVRQYLGYDLAALAPEVREELLTYFLANNGDIRSVHYAIATSAVYLQTSMGESDSAQRYTVGPRKQMLAEDWLASVAKVINKEFPICDHRISRPDDFVSRGTGTAKDMVEASRWDLRNDDSVETHYSDLVKTLGGCPSNGGDSRFSIVSILTTSTQLGLANTLCDPSNEGADGRAPVAVLLPTDTSGTQTMSADVAEEIGGFQSRRLLGRPPTMVENTAFREAGTACAAATCSAEEFARVSCFAVLSSAELLFY